MRPRARTRPRWISWTLVPVTLVAGACATTGATLGSGVGDAFPEHPPYYAGAGGGTGRASAVGHLPVAYQRGGAQAPIFDPEVTGATAALLADINAYLDHLGVSTRLAEGGTVSAVTHAATRYPPDVHFGCLTEPGAAEDECAVDDDGAPGRGGLRMHLAVGRPSPEWTAWAADIMEGSGVDATLVITLEVGQYPVRQRGLRGTKEVELGTDHVVRLPWLTSLETPVQVLQLTGALVGPDGRALRIGAEGLLARRTPMRWSALGAQALLSEGDVDALRTARRDDLEGAPLVWEVGLRTLVEGLVGR